MPIPIRNIYYLLCYAWGRFKEGEMLRPDVEDSPDLPNLIAKTLARGIRRLRRRGLERGYIVNRELTSRLRGRILFTESLKDASLFRARLHCNFDELEVDILSNQILKSTVLSLLGTHRLEATVRAELREIAYWLAPVSVITLHPSLFHRIKYHRNNQLYGFLIRVCQMIHEELLPTGTAGRFQFRKLVDSEERMGLLFEEFAHNFYQCEQTEFIVSRDRIRWVANSDEPNHLSYLPSMHTDISLRSPEKVIVVDCKYYLKTLQTWHGTSSIHSAHLYQLFAYLVNLRPRIPADVPIEGVLLYPRTEQSLNLKLFLHDYSVRVYTIDLAQDWPRIHEDLLRLLKGHSEVSEPAA
jgi:5-methylcytosine-specific restriction enzyme subunit McrC